MPRPVAIVDEMSSESEVFSDINQPNDVFLSPSSPSMTDNDRDYLTPTAPTSESVFLTPSEGSDTLNGASSSCNMLTAEGLDTPENIPSPEDNLQLNDSGLDQSIMRLESPLEGACSGRPRAAPCIMKQGSGDSSTSLTLGRSGRFNSSTLSLESLDLEVPSSYQVEPVDFPSSPAELKKVLGFNLPIEVALHHALSDEEEDKSIFQAQLLSNCQDVKLTKDPSNFKGEKKRKVIAVADDILSTSRLDDDQKTETETESSLDGSHMSPDDPDLDLLLDTDELEESIMERLGRDEVPPIPVLTAQEETLESRSWKPCVVGGAERRMDLKVLEPYKRVVSHGGYLSQGSRNAIIVFSGCFLPDRSRLDYDYVMTNLFMYVITTLDQLVTDDYVLIYLHGATARSCVPKFRWLKQCYQMIDRKLRKNLKGLYLVHPTFWLKTVVFMAKPFISSKFSKKLFYVSSLSELFRKIPLEQASIPDRVKKYDALKESLGKSD